MKRGDEVWIKAVVLDVSETTGVRLAVGEYGREVWIAKSKCKPVEPEAVQHSACKEVQIRGKGDCAMSIECVNLTKNQVMDILRNQGALFRLAGLSYDSLDGEGCVMLVPDDGVVKYIEWEGGKNEKGR